MGSVLAASACRKTILRGMFAGWLVSFFEERLLHLCILSWNIPATMINLLTSGFVGAFIAVLLSPLA
jgi:hypothetical protein